MTNQKNSLFENNSATNLYGYNLILENILNVLFNLGLTKTQSNILIYLGKSGSKTASQIAETLELTKFEVCSHINSLQKMDLVSASNQCHPTKFTAMPMNGIPVWSVFEACRENKWYLDSEHAIENMEAFV